MNCSNLERRLKKHDVQPTNVADRNRVKIECTARPGLFAIVKPSDYIVLGTIDRRIRRRGLGGDAELTDIREHMADFRKYVNVDVVPAHGYDPVDMAANLRMAPTR